MTSEGVGNGSDQDGLPRPYFRYFTETTLPSDPAKYASSELPSSSGVRDKALEEGKVLSKELMKHFDLRTMTGVPMEEIDPSYNHQQTFVVFSDKGGINRFSARESLFLLHPLNPLRRLTLYLMTHWAFSAFIVAVVLINVGLLAWKMDDGFDYACMAIYLLELNIKVLSRGLVVDEFTCLRNPWTWLDLIVILTSILRPFNIQLFAVLQWTRLFKIIPHVDELKETFETLLKACGQLCTTFFLGFISLTFFSLLGLNFYMGSLTKKCVNVKGFNMSGQEWSDFCRDSRHWLLDDNNEFGLCGNVSSTVQCPEGFVCLQGFGQSPEYGYTNFDSISWSALSTIRIIRQDYLEKILLQVVTTSGSWHFVYFLLAFFGGTFAIGTLAYASLGQYFLQIAEQTKDEDDLQQQASPGADMPEIAGSLDVPASASASAYYTNFLKSIKSISSHFGFEAFITIIIIWDVFCWIYTYSMDHDQFNPGVMLLISQKWNPLFILVVYFAEFLTKIIANGHKKYLINAWNILDMIILVRILGDFFSEITNPIRILKIIPRWTTLKFTFQLILSSFKQLWGLVGIFLTIWISFALIGTELFGKTYEEKAYSFPNHSTPRWNFVDFAHSFILVFRTFIGESIEPLWDCMLVSGWTCLVYFPFVTFTGVIIIMVASVRVILVTLSSLKEVEKANQNGGNKSTLTKLYEICIFPLILLKNKVEGRGTRVVAEEIPMKKGDKVTDATESVGGSRGKLSQVWQYRNKVQEFSDGRVVQFLQVFVILVTSFINLLDNNNGKSNETLQTIIYSSDMCFTLFFSCLIIPKIFCIGLKSFLKSPMLIFDFVLVLEMILHLSLNLYKDVDFSYSLFTFIRSLRLFMLTSRIPGLKAVVKGFAAELGLLMKYIAASAFIWLFFVMLGYQQFGYSYFKCIDVFDPDKKVLYKFDRDNCQRRNLSWENSPLNFDHSMDGFVTWALVGARNGWISVLFDSFDSVGVHSENFVKDNSVTRSFAIFVAFYILGVFFLLNIFFGVIVHYMRGEKGKGIFFTEAEYVSYKETRNTEQTTIPIPKPGTNVCAKIYDMITTPVFGAVVMVIVLIDVITMGLESYQMDDKMWSSLDSIRELITVLYLVELTLKLLGCGRFYFNSNWNRIDFFVVVTSVLGAILSDLIAKYFINPYAIRLIRLLRILQFQPLISSSWAKSLRKYFRALRLTLPALVNVLLFQVLLMASYSVFGMTQFGNVKMGHGNAHVNFQDAWSSVMSLFMVSSISGIDGVLLTLGNEMDCDVPDKEMGISGDCGNKGAGAFFVFSYLIVSILVIGNMYLTFILEIVSQLRLDSDNLQEEIPLNSIEERNKDLGTESAERLEGVTVDNSTISEEIGGK